MVRGDRQKATGGSAAWINLISLGLLEREHMGKCTKPRTRIQVKVRYSLSLNKAILKEFP